MKIVSCHFRQKSPKTEKNKKNLKIAIAKVEEQNFIGQSSTPDSNQIAQFLASGSGDSSGAANSVQGNLMEHSGTDADS